MDTIILILKSILYTLLGLPLLMGIGNYLIKSPIIILTYIRTHLLLSLHIFLSLIIVSLSAVTLIKFFCQEDHRKPVFAKIGTMLLKFIKNRKLLIIIIIASLSIPYYYHFAMKTSLSLPSIFNTALPVEIFYDQSSDSETNSSSNFRFPFWKAYKIRVLNDLPILANKKTFPKFHYIITQDFYSEGKNVIHSKKIVTCILKNLGEQSLIIRKISAVKFDIKPKGFRDSIDYVPPDYRNHKALIDGEEITIDGLTNYLYYKSRLSPIILFPMEEIILFNVRPDCPNRLSIYIEIEYADYLGQDGINKCSTNKYIYRQIDEVEFDKDSPRSLPAETVYQSKYKF